MTVKLNKDVRILVVDEQPLTQNYLRFWPKSMSTETSGKPKREWGLYKFETSGQHNRDLVDGTGIEPVTLAL